MNNAKRHEIFTRLRAANPAPRTELQYNSPFELLVAVVLSAQATDKSVNLATEKLFRRANTPDEMLKLGQSGLEHVGHDLVGDDDLELHLRHEVDDVRRASVD